MVNLQTCYACGAVYDQRDEFLHRSFHDALPSTTPCLLCGAAVAPFNDGLHRQFHQRMEALEQLINHLVGDVEAHLEYLSK